MIMRFDARSRGSNRKGELEGGESGPIANVTSILEQGKEEFIQLFIGKCRGKMAIGD